MDQSETDSITSSKTLIFLFLDVCRIKTSKNEQTLSINLSSLLIKTEENNEYFISQSLNLALDIGTQIIYTNIPHHW